ncbi:hypothetical protein OAM98_03810 [Schleiferiaceae bacterium]|nr:hypothetical protein [Schleiferiaceae bacterium]
MIQVKSNLSCHTLSNYHQIFVDRDPRHFYLVVRDYNGYPIRLQAKLSVNNNKEQAQDMPAGLGARNRRKMTARLQAKNTVNNNEKQAQDMTVTL